MCKYCEPNDKENFQFLFKVGTEYVSLSMEYRKGIDKQYWLRASGESEVTVSINYCPFCGHYLGGNENGQIQ